MRARLTKNIRIGSNIKHLKLYPQGLEFDLDPNSTHQTVDGDRIYLELVEFEVIHESIPDNRSTE